jgi:threonine/homoserine/homoserine lactone efflux protein
LIAIILKAIGTGLLLSFLIGPVFFVLLETSIRRGVRAAIALDLGVLVSDLTYAFIALILFLQVGIGEDIDINSDQNKLILKIIGGVMFITYGAYSWFKKPKQSKIDEVGNVVQTTGDYLMLGLKGFLLNIANPMVIFYWFWVVSVGSDSAPNKEYHNEIIYLFLGIVFLTFFSVDLLKILGAKRLRPLVTDAVLSALNKVISGVFLFFGIVSLVKAILSIVKPNSGM